MAPGLQLFSQLGVVFDDAVVDHGKLVSAVEVGVGVLVGGPAVGRPAGVADPDPGLPALAAEVVIEDGDPSHLFVHLEGALIQVGHPRGVVAAVLQRLQAVHQYRNRVLAADVADDTAHAQYLLLGCCARLRSHQAPLCPGDHSPDLKVP